MNKTGNKLDQYCHISSGGTPSRRKDAFYGGDILWSTIADMEKSDGVVIDTKEKITPEGLASIGNRIFAKDTLLLAMYGSVGKVAIAGKEMATNQAILGITPKHEQEISIPYLKYWLMSHKRQIIKKARGGILKNLSAKIVKNLKIELPSYDDQIKIANLLTQVEELISKREESIELLDELLKSTFLDMFGDPVLNSKGWDKENIGKVINTSSGATPSRNKPEYYNGTIPWIKSGELNQGIIYHTKEHITKKGLEKSSAKLVAPNTVLIAMYGATVGVSAITKIEATTNQAVCALVPKDKEQINYIFLLHLLRFMKNYLISKSIGGGQPNISQTIIKKTKIILPIKLLQDKFATIVQQVEATKSHYQDSLDEINELFGSLSQRAFHGELDLSGMEVESFAGREEETLEMPTFMRKHVDYTKEIVESIDIKSLKTMADTAKEQYDSLALGDTIKQMTKTAKLFKEINIPSFKIDIPPLYTNIPSFNFDSMFIFKTSKQITEALQKKKEHIYQMLEDIPQIKDAIENDVLCKDDFLEVTLRYDYEYGQIKRIIMDKLSSGALTQHFDEESKSIKLVKAI